MYLVPSLASRPSFLKDVLHGRVVSRSHEAVAAKQHLNQVQRKVPYIGTTVQQYTPGTWYAGMTFVSTEFVMLTLMFHLQQQQ